jgi:hypothetical protein
VSPQQVTIVSVQLHTGGRRLLFAKYELIDVHLRVEGAMRLRQLTSHLSRRGMLVESTEWSVAHSVRASLLLPE